MKKGDVGMAKRFSKKYRNKGWASTTCNPMSRCLSAPDATSLHHCLKNHHQYCTILCWIQALDTKRPGATGASLVKGGLLGERSEPHTGVFNRDFAWYMYICIYVCLSWSKKRRRNHLGQTRACSKSVLAGKIRPVPPVLFISTIR